MGVYIKGMEMPTSCGYCPLRHEARDGDECYLGAKITEYQTRPEDCPLIPVPPHGRLIDADALIKSLSLDESDAENGASLLMAIFLEVLKAAPTIIPANKEDADEES